jgi:hypothetical protein
MKTIKDFSNEYEYFDYLRGRKPEPSNPEPTPENVPMDIARSIVKGIPGGTQAAAALASLRPGMTYDKALERLKLEQELASQRSPVLSTVSEVGGALASSIPMMGVGALGTGLKTAPMIAKSVGKQALAGGAMQSIEPLLEGKSASEIAGEGLMGAGLTAAFPTVGLGVQKLSKAIAPVAKSAKQISRDMYKNSVMSMFNVSKDYIDELEKNPKLFDQVMELPIDREKLGNELASFMSKNPYRKQVQELSKQRDIVLENSNQRIDLRPMVRIFKDAQAELPSKLSKSDEMVSNALDDYIERYGRRQQKFSAAETKQILDGLRGDIERVGSFGDPTVKSGKLESILKNAQSTLNEQIKTQVPAYGKYQKDIQRNLNISNALEKKFLSKQASDMALVDALERGETAQSIIREADPGKIKSFTDRLLSNKATPADLRLANRMMVDYDYKSLNDLIKNIKTKEYIEARKNQGSNIRNTMIALGASAGAPFGIPGALAGSAGGGVLGGVIEQKGGRFAGEAMKLIAPKQSDDILKKAAGTKYAQTLRDALSKGNKSFATTHYLLLQRDPEYRKQIEEE